MPIEAATAKGAKIITGMSWRSQSAQNQSAVPSSRNEWVPLWRKLIRKPFMPGCLSQAGSLSLLAASLSDTLPMTANRSECFLRRFQRVIIAVAIPGRRHQDHPVDAGTIHFRQQALVGQRVFSWCGLEASSLTCGRSEVSACQIWTWASVIFMGRQQAIGSGQQEIADSGFPNNYGLFCRC